MRDARIVHQRVDPAALRKFLKNRPHFLLVGYIAFMSGSFTAAVENLLGSLQRLFRMNIQYIHARSVRRKKVGDGPTNAACTARNDDRFAVEAEPIRILAGIDQSETPLFHGMKSF